ncbi:MAG TPA: glycosyl hydrolase 53 family protein [Ktedonobacteraceae bacterium]|nr:glycosyl hydrolase 53 family protein [Ktedonobacteraceae bacterium]
MERRKCGARLALMVMLALIVGGLLPSVIRPQTASAGITEPAGNNIAVGHPAMADSQQVSQPASSGDDGDASTFWCANDGNTGHWWMVDLQTYNNLTGAGIDFGVNAYYQYIIQVSQDAIHWRVVANQTSNTDTNPYQYDAFTAVAQRYVRITITGMQAGQWACFAEFKVYAISQGENVAVNKIATADSSQSGEQASNAVDGTVDSSWCPAATPGNHWLQVDLQYVYNLTGAEVIWASAAQNSPSIIETSLDGIHWQPAWLEPQNTHSRQVSYDVFPQVSARYVRLILTARPGASAPCVDEFEVFQPFMKGVDVSTLLLMEENGAVYYENGVRKNFLQILKENGVNYVRVRLWVNPANPPQDQPGVDDLPYVMAMARQIKAFGLQFYLDFHYSDTWADPGHQTVPAAWANETPSQLAQTVHDYTEHVIVQLKSQGTLPDMVQIGNEINCGMLWPTGDICTNSANWANFASYVNAGIAGVNDALSPQEREHIRIALHYAGNYPQWWLNGLISNGVTGFDTIALSWYIFWHGGLSTLEQLIPSLKAQYGRDVIVAEYAYPWTFQNFDSTANSVTSVGSWSNYYPVSPLGQQQLIEDELSTVKDTGGLGAFYWEPGWYAVPGAGWIGGQGDGWENMTQVDQYGNVLKSVSAYSRY